MISIEDIWNFYIGAAHHDKAPRMLWAITCWVYARLPGKTAGVCILKSTERARLSVVPRTFSSSTVGGWETVHRRECNEEAPMH